MNITDLFLVLGGLGLFFLGMKLMGDGLELAAGNKLRTLLEKITANKYLGMLVGLVVTAVIQSSSATAAMVVGFTNAGLMELAQTVGILFGSKIGTCMTSVLLSFDMGSIVPLFIFIGVCVIMFVKKNNYKYYGQIFAGFGILFYGMTVMSDGLKALNSDGMIDNILKSVNNPLIGLLLGTVITAIIQSSSASVGILMALGAAGAISIEQAIFIVYGMNLGACMPAFLSAMGAKRNAKQVAILNLLITLFGVILLVPLTMLLPVSSTIESILPGNVSAQISASHIFFNVVNMVVFLPFSSLLVKLTQKILPYHEDPEKDKMAVEFIDNRILTTPPMAVLQCEKEVARLSRLVQKNYNRSLIAFFDRDKSSIEKVLDREKVIDYLSKQITDYIVKINGLDIEDHDRQIVAAMYSAIQDLERIGDHAENIVEYTRTVLEENLKFSDTAMNEMRDICEKCRTLMELSFAMFNAQGASPELIERIIQVEDEVDECKDDYKMAHIARMNGGLCNAESGAVFLNMLIDIERVGDHAINVAFAIPNRQKQVITAKA
ncbi:MAG: Na/Pi cotransporter family protein [Ruminococcus sp.]|nr:Na/Pi cotransporter family protein [Ruminococcus sp.]MBQ9515042.1 Na/Pi cotransporter family protein [Ruminococcus sp.]